MTTLFEHSRTLATITNRYGRYGSGLVGGYIFVLLVVVLVGHLCSFTWLTIVLAHHDESRRSEFRPCASSVLSEHVGRVETEAYRAQREVMFHLELHDVTKSRKTPKTPKTPGNSGKLRETPGNSGKLRKSFRAELERKKCLRKNVF